MTLIELLKFIVLVTAGLFGAFLASHYLGWIGYPLGFIASIGLIFGMFILLIYFEQMRRVGKPAFPSCRTGKCTSVDYHYSIEKEEIVCRCKCGDRYERVGRRLLFVHEDGTREPFKVWWPFDGWYADQVAKSVN
jgi:uncharacterized membrane protein